MGKYIVRRLLQMIPVILGVTFIIFVMVYGLPGDPVAGRCGERPCPPAYVAKFRAEHNLDKPLIVQYLLYLGNLLQGDLGTTFTGRSVAHELAIRWPTTIKLALMAIIFEIVVGISAGVLAGMRRGKFVDHLVTVSTLLADLHPDLRHRQRWLSYLRREAGPVPGHRRPRAPSTS